MTVQVLLNDWLGTHIVPGSIIVYPGRHGSRIWMTQAEVIELKQEFHYGQFKWVLMVQPMRSTWETKPNARPVKITAIEKVTVIPDTRDRAAA